MALIKCPECGKEISDKAPACIHCDFLLSLVEKQNEPNVTTLKDDDIKESTVNDSPSTSPNGYSLDKKISTALKAGSVFMWGLLSQKVKKQWHCNNCGYEW